MGQTPSENAMPPDDATPPGNATPSDASTANGAHQQHQEEAGVELQCLAQPQAQVVQPENRQTTPLQPPQSPRPQAQTDAPAQHPPAPPIDERNILIPMPAPTTQDEAEAGVRRELPMSVFPTAAELDDSVTCFHRYLGLYFMMAAALGTPILPTLVPKASSWLSLS